MTEAIYNAGFNSGSRFYADAAGALGMTPRKFRAGGVDEVLTFAVGRCSLGAILVAASEKGVGAVLLGDDPRKLSQDLQKIFPKARLIGGDRQFEKTVALVIDLVEKPEMRSELPLDVRGTAFQQRVWKALREIPAGSTATYTQIAKRIGNPKSVRAVARACATNPLAILTPCHRVVRADGGVAGYRWGVERKQTLLQREAASRRKAGSRSRG